MLERWTIWYSRLKLAFGCLVPLGFVVSVGLSALVIGVDRGGVSSLQMGLLGCIATGYAGFVLGMITVTGLVGLAKAGAMVSD